MTPKHPSTILLELVHLPSGHLEDADVFARLDTAIEKAYLHVCEAKFVGVRVEVSVNDGDTIDGVGFFDFDNNMLACITVYQTEFDSEEPSIDAVRAACALAPGDMQEQLNALLRAAA